MRPQVFRAAAVQAAPVFLDLDATVEKTCRLIQEAGERGYRLVVFPETFIPGFPFWPKDPPRSERDKVFEPYSLLFQNSVEVPSEQTRRLGEAARKAVTYVVLGVNEKDAVGGTVYNSLLYFGPEGHLLGKHRKLVPTYHERCVWGRGDGSGLRVYDTEVGRIGGLICYEHHMPLVKYALFSKGEQVHAAVWPSQAYLRPVIEVATRQYAFEGRTFVISACGYLTKDQVPEDFPLREETLWDADGGSAIISPLGQHLAGPVYDREEIVCAEIDLGLILRAKVYVDSVGHSARPDVARLLLNEEKRTVMASSPGGPREVEDALEVLARQAGPQAGEDVREALRILR